MRAGVGIALAMLAGIAAAEAQCIDDGYDILRGERERYVAEPAARGPVITVDPERPEPAWIDDTQRPGVSNR